MKLLLKNFLSLVFKATYMTMALSAALHMGLLAFTAIHKGDPSTLNPIYFLGINLVVSPEVSINKNAPLIAWTVLVGAGIIIFFIMASRELSAARKHSPIYKKAIKIPKRLLLYAKLTKEAL